jgi:tetratricopeptide (TPR) repeat protein
MTRPGDNTPYNSIMRSSLRTSCIVLGTLVALLVCAREGAAEPRRKQAVQTHYNQGMKQYTLGHFPDAIEEFEKAYDLKPEPIFLYNIAQSHRQNKNPERALFFYRRYLEAEPQAKNRAEIEKRMQEMQALLAEEKERAATPPISPPPVAPTPPPAPVVVAPPPVQPPPPVAPPDAASANPGRGLRIAGIVVGCVGLAGIGTGIIFGVHSNTLYNDAHQGTYDKSKDDSSKTFQTLEWVSLGVGGAAVATGIVLYIIGATATDPDRTVSLVPLLAPGMRGIALSGRL